MRIAFYAPLKWPGHRVPSGDRLLERMFVAALHRKPVLFVLVVGEAARAEDFAIDGYQRDTTPYLSHSDVVSFTNVHSCGTSTAESLPCMFSPFGRQGASADTARGYESLLDVVQRAGFGVLWLDNNSGCKGTCAGVDTLVVNHESEGKPGRLCADDECYDEALVQEIDAVLARRQGNLFIVTSTPWPATRS